MLHPVSQYVLIRATVQCHLRYHSVPTSNLKHFINRPSCSSCWPDSKQSGDFHSYQMMHELLFHLLCLGNRLHTSTPSCSHHFWWNINASYLWQSQVFLCSVWHRLLFSSGRARQMHHDPLWSLSDAENLSLFCFTNFTNKMDPNKLVMKKNSKDICVCFSSYVMKCNLI